MQLTISPASRNLILVGSGLLLTALTTPPASAELIAYEGFDYALEDGSTLNNGRLNGGTGWSSPWGNSNSASQDAIVQEGSLGYTDAEGRVLMVSGHHASVSGVSTAEAQRRGLSNGFSTNVSRALAQPPETMPGSRVYISFLGQRTGEALDPGDAIWHNDPENYPSGYPWGENLYPRGAGVQLLAGHGSSDTLAHIGNLSDRSVNAWSFAADSTEFHDAHPFTEVAFVVLRLDYSAHQSSDLRGNLVDQVGTTVRMWVNPSDLSTELEQEAHEEFVLLDYVDPYEIDFEALGFSAGDDSYNRQPATLLVDEIRVGTSWSAVTPYEGQDPDRVDPVDPDMPTVWGGRVVSLRGNVDAGPKLGTLWVRHAPWVYSYKLQTWLYLPEDQIVSGSAWIHAENAN